MIATNIRVLLRFDRDGWRLWVKADLPGTVLRYVSFILLADEACEAARGTVATFKDGFRTLRVAGDSWLITDLESLDCGNASRDEHGEVSVPFARFSVPSRALRILTRYAAKKHARLASTFAADRYHSEDTEIPLSPAHLARAERLYSQGSGRVVWNVAPDMVERATRDAASDPRFFAKLDQIASMARNRTRSVYQTARASLYRDGEYDYTWRAAGIFGGLVDHGTARRTDPFAVRMGSPDGEHDWSLHT